MGQNTPTGCGNNLPIILRISKDQKNTNLGLYRIILDKIGFSRRKSHHGNLNSHRGDLNYHRGSVKHHHVISLRLAVTNVNKSHLR